MAENYMIVVGPIASGKTTIAQFFEGNDIEVIDVDHITHRLQQPKTKVWRRLRELLNDEYFLPDNTLHRKNLRALITMSPYFKKRVEDIVHPSVVAEAKKSIKNSCSPYVVLVIPLIFKKEQWHDARLILATEASTETRLQRLMARDKVSEKQALARMNTQKSMDTYLELADASINTEDDPDEIEEKLTLYHKRMLV